MTIDRKALFKISYGLYVVSSADASGNSGFIGNTVFQITSKPPRVAIGISHDNHTHGVIVNSGKIAVSVLNQNVDIALIQTFGYKSSRDIDKFANFAWRVGENGSPIIINGAQASFECSVLQRVELETHDIFIGEVMNADATNDTEPPLTYEYYREVLKGKAPVNAPTFVEEQPEISDSEVSGVNIRVCSVCRHEYDPEKGDPDHGIAPGTPFESLPADWKCPVCASPKEVFA